MAGPFINNTIPTRPYQRALQFREGSLTCPFFLAQVAHFRFNTISSNRFAHLGG